MTLKQKPGVLKKLKGFQAKLQVDPGDDLASVSSDSGKEEEELYGEEEEAIPPAIDRILCAPPPNCIPGCCLSQLLHLIWLSIDTTKVTTPASKAKSFWQGRSKPFIGVFCGMGPPKIYQT